MYESGEASSVAVPVSDRLYTRQFFHVGAAILLFMTGVALRFHLGQFVAWLGYGVDALGLILSIGMIGTLLVRLQIGRWIDRFGGRPTWIAGSIGVAVAVGLMQFVRTAWLIVPLQAVAAMAQAAAMTTSAVFAAQLAPPHRRAEALGTLGLAGFLGMMFGPALGDWIFQGPSESPWSYHIFFTASAGLSALAGLTIHRLRTGPGSPDFEATYAPRAVGPAVTARAQWRVVLQHWPGTILLVGLVFHMAFTIQMSFLERVADERGFHDIKLFFLAYCPSAIVLRIVFRRVPEMLGRTRTVVGGLTLFGIGICTLIGLRTQAGLILPGLLMGAGHCFVFPSMVDLSAESLPPQYRGTGTSLILAAGDLGMLIGFGVLGELIDWLGFDRAVAVQAAVVFLGAGVFAAARWRRLLGVTRSRAASP